MDRWHHEDLVLLSRTTEDLTALAATIEVLRRRQPSDATVERAQRIVERLEETLTQLVERLRQ